MDDDDDFGDLYSDVLPPQLGPTAPPTSWSHQDDDDITDRHADVIPSLPPTTEPSSDDVTLPNTDVAPTPNPDLSNLDNRIPIPGLSANPSNSEEWDSDSEDDLQIVLNDTGHGQFTGIEEEEDDGKEDLVIVTDDGQFTGIEERDWGEEGADGEGKELGEGSKLGAVAGARGGFGFHSQHHSMFKYIRPGAAPLTGASPVTGAVGPAGAVRPPLLLPGRGRSDWRPVGGRGFANAQRSFGYGSPWANNLSARGFAGGLDFTLPSHKSIFDVDIESFEEKPWRISGVDISDFFNFGFDEEKWKDYCKQLDQLRLESTMQSKIRVYESGRSEQEYDPDLPPELAAAAGHHDISADNGYNKTENGQVDYSGQGNGPSVLHAPLPTGRPIQVETGSGERLPSVDTRPPRMRDPECVIEIALDDFFGDPSCKSEPEKFDNNFQGGEDKCVHDGKAEGKNTAPEGSNISSCPPSSRNNERTRRVPLAPDGDDISSLPSESSAECNLKSKMRSPKYSRGTSRKHLRGRLLEGPSHLIDSKSPECSVGATVSQNTHSNKLCIKKTEKDTNEIEVVQNSDKPPAVANETAKDLNVDNQFDEEDGKLALVDSIDNEGDDVASDYHVSSETVGDESIVCHNKKQKLGSQVKPSVQQTSEEDELRTSNSENSRSISASSRDHPRYTRNGEEAAQEGRTTETTNLRRSHREKHNYWRKDDYIYDARQEMDRNRVASRSRKETVSHPHLYRDHGLSAHPAQGRSFERTKDIDSFAGTWQRREDKLLTRRTKDEDIRWENNNAMMSRHRGKLKAGDRNQRDEDNYSRKHVEDVEWRGHSKDGGSRTRERDDLSSSNLGNIDEAVKRKRDDEYLRGKAEKDGSSHRHRNRDDSGRRKREREDATDHRRREDSRENLVDHRRREDSTRVEAVDHFPPAKHKGGSWHHRDREDKHRIKQSQESALTDREKEDVRGAERSGQGIEDKTVSENARRKEGPTAGFSDKEHQDKDRKQATEQLRRGDRYREDSLPQHKARGNISSREKLVNNDGKSLRHERQSMCDGHLSNASDKQQVHRERHRENTRKGKDNEVEEQKGQVLGKKKHVDHGDRQNKASAKVLYEEESSNASGHICKNDQRHYESLEQPDRLGRKLGEEDLVSDDDIKETSRRGRSKLERWTSPKEKEFRANDNLQTLTSSRSKIKEVGISNVDMVATEELANLEAEPCDNTGGLDTGKIGEKTVEDQGSHLDTVAKLKKRSERFKMPMPGEKDLPMNRKMESESQLSHNDVSATVAAPTADTDVKPERPARKRRWTSS